MGICDEGTLFFTLLYGCRGTCDEGELFLNLLYFCRGTTSDKREFVLAPVIKGNSSLLYCTAVEELVMRGTVQ